MAHPQETSSPLRQCRVILTPPTYRANFGTLWRPITSIFCPCVDDTSKNTRGERKQGKHQRKMPFTIKTYNTEFTCPICSDQRVVRVLEADRDLNGLYSQMRCCGSISGMHWYLTLQITESLSLESTYIEMKHWYV